MLIIADGLALARALDQPLDHRLKRVLSLRRDQIPDDLEAAARFIVPEPGDTYAAVEAEVGFPIMDGFEPCFEWIVDHGGLFEMAFILSDDSPAQVLLVPTIEGIDPDLLALCRRFARKAQHLSTGGHDAVGADSP